MPNVLPIADPEDDRLADYRHLTDAGLRRAHEEGRQVFVAEGHLVIDQLLRSPYRPLSFLVTEARLPALAALLDITPATGAPVYLATPAVMNAVAGFDIHRGLLAVAARRPLPAVAEIVTGSNVIAVLEGINDHENMGAIFRSAAALSVDGVLLDRRCCDPLYRRSVRVSMGHVLRIPYTVATAWPGVLNELRAAGFAVLALTPRPSAEPIERVDLTGRRVALLLGAEGDGLSSSALDAADEHVRIPISGGVDSLNVATAAAIAFHRASR